MRRRLKPLSARVTRVIFLSLIRSSFVYVSTFILFIFLLDNIIAITQIIKFLFLNFDHSLPFPFDSDGRCCRCLLCTKVSSRQNFNLLPLVVAVFLFYMNWFVIHLNCNRITKELELIISYNLHYNKLRAKHTRPPYWIIPYGAKLRTFAENFFDRAESAQEKLKIAKTYTVYLGLCLKKFNSIKPLFGPLYTSFRERNFVTD